MTSTEPGSGVSEAHSLDLVLRGMGGIVCLVCTCGWNSSTLDDDDAQLELELHLITEGAL